MWQTSLKFLKRIYLSLEKYIALTGAVILMLWLIEPTRVILIDKLSICVSDETGGKICDPEPVIIAILGILVFVFWRLFVEFDKKIDILNTTVNKTVSDNIIPGGVNYVYDEMEKIIKECMSRPRSPRQKFTFEVLGLNLFTAWPRTHAHLLNNNFSGWNIYLYCLSPDFIRSNNDTISRDWATEVESKISEIKRFVTSNSQKLHERDISLSLISYSHFPAIHGFRINDADILFSIVDWTSDNLIADPSEQHHFYRYVASSEASPRAHLYRSLFKSWIDRANRTGANIL